MNFQIFALEHEQNKEIEEKNILLENKEAEIQRLMIQIQQLENKEGKIQYLKYGIIPISKKVIDKPEQMFQYKLKERTFVL